MIEDVSKIPTERIFSLDDPREEQRDACGVGFIANMKGQKSHRTLRDGLDILANMDHRGGLAADNKTSDGSGILLQIPHEILAIEATRHGKSLPPLGSYAVGMIFLPKDESEGLFWQNYIDSISQELNLSIAFFRNVPVDSSILGPIALESEPAILQCVILDTAESTPSKALNWRLFLARKKIETEGAKRYGEKQRKFYVASLSQESICYKGLLKAKDLPSYYLDLQDPLYVTSFAMVHQRFSTNTLPSWPLAQPFRLISHNGEINTLRGNMNAMHARQFLLEDKNLAHDFQQIGPVCVPGMSDSSMLDNAVEFLIASGRPLTQVLTMLIPEPWERNAEMDPALKAYYEYHSYIMEPWDGPAFVGFYHGNQIGAILDRNGLRPGRYCITRDGFVIMASEAGVLERKPEDVLERGRLKPGSIFLLDMASGKIIPDARIKNELSHARPYGSWLNKKRIHLSDLPVTASASSSETSESDLTQKMISFGYTKEDLRTILAPMANSGKEPLGSMGNDSPIAILSRKKPLLYNYFKQLFAQVTNPPIDALREELVTSLSVNLGSEANLLQQTEDHCAVLKLPYPIITAAELLSIERTQINHLKSIRVSTTYALSQCRLESALRNLCKTVINAVENGISLIILSDKDVSATHTAIPALLALSSVHHSLMASGHRSKCSLIVESGEPREVHHFALLIGYGASAINPYLALEVIRDGAKIFGFDQAKSCHIQERNYIKSVCDGILKIMSKMGISVLQSYRGAQIFECLGLNTELVSRYFCHTPARLGGLTIGDIEDDIFERHQLAYSNTLEYSYSTISDNGIYTWRRNGENHLHGPDMIAALQKSVRKNSREDFKAFCRSVDQNVGGAVTLRSLLSFRKVQPSLSIDLVEDVKSIVRRIATGAMSFGSISKETHETIAIAMNRIGARSNSGEGGEDSKRYTKDKNGDSRRSSIKQIASARFGVTSHYLTEADELQIKIAQGAKPGEGGQLPGFKVDDEIAAVRHSTPGVTLISPPPHHDIYSIEDLAQLIFDLKNANREARISVKLVSESGVGTVAAGVAKAKADVILISGHEGGTGASPLSSVQHAGIPWELGVSETHRMLVENHLRDRVVVQTDGLIRTPRDIVIAALLGAEEWGIGTGALLTLGCIMMRKCHLNTCPVGIATQDPELRKKFQGQPEHLINYVFLLAEGVRELMAELGFARISDMIGRADLLEKNPNISDVRLKKIDLSCLLMPPKALDQKLVKHTDIHDDSISSTLDATTLIPACLEAIDGDKKFEISQRIKSVNRSTGTMLSSVISKKWGQFGMPKGEITLKFEGSAGQSFMAFGAKGLKAILKGEVNDYCAKGLSGATVVVRPEEGNTSPAEEQVICGNTALYGATSGHLYLNGRAGERFAVRNSGASAVVEGLGDHGCEYMTGGHVVVIGPIGRNFAAGMSGGYAYLYDPHKISAKRINADLVRVETLIEDNHLIHLKSMLEAHLNLTSSSVAAKILRNWDNEKRQFLLVIPTEYQLMMEKRQAALHKKAFSENVTGTFEYLGGEISG